MADLSGVTLPHTPASAAMSTAAETITVDGKIQAVYIFIDDATAAPGIGLVSTDGTNYAPILGRCWELIYMRPLAGAPVDRTILVKVSSGTPTRYLRVF